MVLSLVPAVLSLDESLGLGLLFTVRGTVAPPAEVAVVSISRDSAAAVGQPAELDRWQRARHAELLDSLTEAGAEAVAFDVFFDEPRADDARFAEAIAHAGNVVLGERIVQDPDGSSPALPGLVESHVLPIDELGRAALASAPFALPVIPYAVGQFWTFGPSGDLPSLPAVALQAYLLRYYDDFAALLASVRPRLRVPTSRAALLRAHDLPAAMGQLRAAFASDASLAVDARAALERRPGDEASRALGALIGLYAGAESRYLNYYGPARTIRTIPFDVALRSRGDLDLRGKMVFVGGSEPRQSEQQDYFHSVFSQQTGANLSGVEIGATAFANLLGQRSIVALPMWATLLLVALWGAALAAVVGATTARAFVLAAAAGALYFAWVYWQFDAHGLWWPLLVPLALQPPVAVALAVLLNYAEVLRQRELIQAALGRYVPQDVVRRLSEQNARSVPERRLLQGACLCTDVESYMTVAETLDARELAELMDEYFGVLSRVVKEHGGFVVDAAGDALIAVWAAAGPLAESRLRACRAALGVVAAVDEFNARRIPQLPTRVGVESGELLLGDFGPEERLGYRAIGDIVNTASRLEGLNKILGTRVLVSAATLAGTSELAARDVGMFLLRGKSTPLRVQELLSVGEGALWPPAMQFAAALEQLVAARWADAQREFAALRAAFPEDGPTVFYAALSADYARAPPRNWAGAVVITAK